jgi:hypothetical protein
MTVATALGYTFTVTGARVNTSATVAPPATYLNPAPPPASACTATAVAVTPNPVVRNGANLASALIVTATLAGVCSPTLSISYIPSGTVVVTEPLTLSGGVWTGTIPATGAAWSTGAKAATLVQGNGRVPGGGSTNFTVQDPPCTVTALTTNPATVAQGAGGVGLTAAVTVSATTSGACALPLRLTYTPTAGATTLAATGTNPASATIAATTSFAPGTQTVSVAQADASAVQGTAATSFTVTPSACTVVALTASPSAVGQGLGGRGLAGPVTVTATLASGCATPPLLTFTPASGPVTTTMTASGTTWVAMVPAAGYDFATGPQTVSIAAAGATTTGATTTSFTVTPWLSPCTLQSAQPAAPSQNQRDKAGTLNQDERTVLQPGPNATCNNIAIEYQTGNGTIVQRAVVAEGQNITGIIPAHTEVFSKNQDVTVLVLDTTNGGRTQLWSTSFQTI